MELRSMFACQWDETSQRFKAMLKDTGTAGDRQTTTGLLHQVMVFSGIVADVGVRGDGLQVEPWLARPMVVDSTSANHLLQAVLRSLPFDISDRACMERISVACDVMLFTITTDRASSNAVVGAWLAQQVDKLPRHFLPWCEFCIAHGCALAQGRSAIYKKLSSALLSLTHWLRHHRNLEALSAEIRIAIAGDCAVRREPCPAEFLSRGQGVVSWLHRGDSSALWTR